MSFVLLAFPPSANPNVFGAECGARLPSELSQWDFSDISQLYASTFLWSIAVIMVGSIDVQNALNTHQDLLVVNLGLTTYLDEKTFIGILITTQRDSDGSNV